MKTVNLSFDYPKKDIALIQAKLKLHGVQSKLIELGKGGKKVEIQINEMDLEKAVQILAE